MRSRQMMVMAILVAAAMGPANAEVIETSDTGFLVESEAVIKASPLTVYGALTTHIDRWWAPAHTFAMPGIFPSIRHPEAVFASGFPTRVACGT